MLHAALFFSATSLQAALLLLAVLGSGVCELTNESRLGIGYFFKETGVFLTEGERRAAAPDRAGTKACKPKI